MLFLLQMLFWQNVKNNSNFLITFIKNMWIIEETFTFKNLYIYEIEKYEQRNFIEIIATK